MSIEKEGASMPGFWLRMSLRFPIVGFTGAAYYPHEHGTPSKNIPLPDEAGILLAENYLLWDRLPFVPTEFHANSMPQPDTQIFAIGSLIYLCPDEKKRHAIGQFKSSSESSTLSYKRLEDLGAEPKAMVMIDLDCPNTRENFWKIHSTLEKSCKGGWSIFETDDSFHIVYNKLVKPEDLPMEYGEIIRAFALSEPENRRDYFEKIGHCLINFRNDPEKLREICQLLIEDVSHYKDPDGKGLKFIVDLRWIAHSVIELLDFLETRKGGFAYLRISKKTQAGSPPKLTAIHRIDKMVDGRMIELPL